jgi:hypothetical protein
MGSNNIKISSSRFQRHAQKPMQAIAMIKFQSEVSKTCPYNLNKF